MIQLENLDCKIFTDNVEPEALEMIYSVAKSPEFKRARIRIMPDTHTGKGIVIGFTAPLGNYVNPSHVGCDIGCSVSAIIFDEALEEKDYATFERRIKREIPQGRQLQDSRQFDIKEFLKFVREELRKAEMKSGGLVRSKYSFNKEKDIEDWCRDIGIDLGIFYKSIGTLGGGNHYLEYDRDPEQGITAFTVHTGSRNLGLKVFSKWNRISNSNHISRDGEKKIIEEVKSRVQDKNKLGDEIKKALDEYKLNLHPGYLSGEDMSGYLTDVAITQAYAKWNHKIILEKAEKIHNKLTGSRVIKTIQTSHNYIDFDTPDGTPIIRKGAVRAIEGELFLVPFNMRDGIAICEGLSNPDWNYSCCHGAGRIMSRSAAKNNLNMDEFREQMKNVYSTTINQHTLDESPMAYKDTNEIIELIKPTCNIINFMIPLINIKCGENENYW